MLEVVDLKGAITNCLGVHTVGEGSQAVEFFLASGVPERQFNVDVVDEDVYRRVVSPVVLFFPI